VSDDGAAGASLVARYRARGRRTVLGLVGLVMVVALVAVVGLTVGRYHLSAAEVLTTLTGGGDGRAAVVIWRIRLPRIAAAVVAGWGLSLSGLLIQTLMRNPLASPSTLGLSHGAAFGAAAAVVLGGGLAAVPAAAFAGALATTVVILALTRRRRLEPSAIVLAGVAFSALFSAATIVTQYLATDRDLAVIVFWAFGDVTRATVEQVGVTGAVTLVLSLWALRRAWDFNALAAGDDGARSLGVDVDGLRRWGMVAATLLAALVTAFHGVIAFLGLLAPHTARLVVGTDTRLAVPGCAVVGALLLLVADTAGRGLVGTGSLPVGVVTSFLGAPLFLVLLLREEG